MVVLTGQNLAEPVTSLEWLLAVYNPSLDMVYAPVILAFRRLRQKVGRFQGL